MWSVLTRLDRISQVLEKFYQCVNKLFHKVFFQPGKKKKEGVFLQMSPGYCQDRNR